MPESAIRWLGLAGSAAQAAPDSLVLQGNFTASVRVSEIQLDAEPPLASALLPVEVDVLPQALAAVRQRAAWFWAPALWQQDAERVFAVAQAWNLQRLYVSVPVVDGEVQDIAALQAFVMAAHARGLAVWPVLGDPRHVLDSERAALAVLVAALQRYHQQAEPEAKLDGLQLDIEPHLLPGFALAQASWRDAWLATVQAVQRQLATELPLDLVVPVWWGTHADWGQALLQGLAGPGLSLTVMNYRTDPAALRRGAQPFLVWGQQSAVPVAMALEAGSIGPDEQRLHFVRSPAAAGSAEDPQSGEDRNELPHGAELLWLSLGDYRVLVLLESPVSGLALPSYRLQRESRASAAAITFAGDLLQLETVAARVEPEWTSWSSYSGLALHGLDEVLLHGSDAAPPVSPRGGD